MLDNSKLEGYRCYDCGDCNNNVEFNNPLKENYYDIATEHSEILDHTVVYFISNDIVYQEYYLRNGETMNKIREWLFRLKRFLKEINGSDTDTY